MQKLMMFFLCFGAETLFLVKLVPNYQIWYKCLTGLPLCPFSVLPNKFKFVDAGI